MTTTRNTPLPTIAPNAALIVVDVQRAFENAEFWGPRDNPEAEANIGALMDAWQAAGRPIVLVRHTSPAGTILGPDQPGHAWKQVVADRAEHAVLEVRKTVNSAFHGTPDLHAWLGAEGIDQIVVIGIQTNMCVETTARVGGNLGHRVLVPLDATHTFDLAGPDGVVAPAAELARATAVNLHGGRFARVVTTADVLAALEAPEPARA
ncbi:cysteine hydrolase family protein [Streptomyces sp. BI20]|uniref:cysteine hydrolase family protein n=1 Tax=Streptomyces sp. BI20 TaxID=3403460 RepID=UPI003C77770F